MLGCNAVTGAGGAVPPGGAAQPASTRKPREVSVNRWARMMILPVSSRPEAADTNGGDLARCVEAEQPAGSVAARKDEFHDVEGLLVDPAGLHNLGTQRRCSVAIEGVRHRLDSVVGHLGAVGAYCERSVRPTCISANQCIANAVPPACVGPPLGDTRPDEPTPRAALDLLYRFQGRWQQE